MREPEDMDTVAEAAERTIQRVAPGLARVIKYGAPTYRGVRDVVTIGVWKRFVAVGFWRGADLAREHEGLRGAGARTRTYRLHSTAEARSRRFAGLVRAAARLDASADTTSGSDVKGGSRSSTGPAGAPARTRRPR